MNSRPVNATPVNAAPVNAAPVNATPVNATPVNTVAPVPIHDIDGVVTVLHEHALAICARASRPLSLVRLTVRDIVVELNWQYGEPASPEPAPAVPAAVPAVADPVPTVAGQARPGPTEAAPAVFALCAPMVGVFYRALQPGARPFVTEGDVV